MTEHCTECGFDYASAPAATVGRRLRAETVALAEAVRQVGSAPCPVPGCWTAIEYGGHVRDMLIVQRERVLHACGVDTPSIIPMGRDLRVDRGEYVGLDADDIARQLGDAVDSFARTLDNLAPADWKRQVVYNYPERAHRDLEWVAAHTVHEILHHTLDVRRHRQR